MKIQEIKELKNKPVGELIKMLHDDRERLRVLRFDLIAGKVKNEAELRTIKRDIARLLTFIKLAEVKENAK